MGEVHFRENTIIMKDAAFRTDALCDLAHKHLHAGVICIIIVIIIICKTYYIYKDPLLFTNNVVN